MQWSRAHEQQRQRILELLAREARPFDDVSDEAIRARRALPFLDWCRTYLPHYFDCPFAPFHGRMVESAGEAGMPTFVAAFRGAGKSVLLSVARPLWRTLGRQVPYWIYGACTQELASQDMDYVRIELGHNPRIACDYPGLAVEGSAETWIVEMPARKIGGRWGLRSVKFEAFGIGMSPRGHRHAQYRPTEFVGDDLENSELARNPRREQNLWDWMMDDVLPALEPERYVFTVLGTTFGPDCMIERARRKAEDLDPQGRPLVRLFLQRATEHGRSVWPERFSDEALARVRAQIGLRNWLRNYDLCAEDPDKPFQAAWLEQRYKAVPSGLDVVAFLDPALSQSATGCPRALVCVGADRATGERYALDAWIARGTPEQMLDKLVEFWRRWTPRVIGIETNGGYALIRPLLDARTRKIGRLPVRYVDHHEAKDDRIQRLVPEMETGRWRWPESASEGVRALQDQFLSYPDGFVDGPDAAAGCTEFLPSAWGGGRRAGEPIHHTIQSRRDLAGVL